MWKWLDNIPTDRMIKITIIVLLACVIAETVTFITR